MEIAVDHESGQVYYVWASKPEMYLEHHQISMMKHFAKTSNNTELFTNFGKSPIMGAWHIQIYV